jgi:hypothetical protein
MPGEEHGAQALEDGDANPKDRMEAAKAIASELRVYGQKNGTDYAKQWVGDSLSSIMAKKSIDIDGKIVDKYAPKDLPGPSAPPETPAAPGPMPTPTPGTPEAPTGAEQPEAPIIPDDELSPEDAAGDLTDDEIDALINLDDAAGETDTEPTDGQKEAGNYKKGHVELHGMNISIENPRGSTRKGKDEDGKEWESTLTHHYGYIKGTVGKDKDHLDTFIGPNPESDRAFIVNQKNPKTGKFDEHKIMLGFDNEDDARKGYLSNYEEGWTGLGSIHELGVDDLKTWAFEGDTKTEIDPKDYPEFQEEVIGDEGQGEGVQVEGEGELRREAPPALPDHGGAELLEANSPRKTSISSWVEPGQQEAPVLLRRTPSRY